MISVCSVTTTYGAQTVLNDISVDFPRAKLTALIGPNGAGKSTLLKTIGRLLPPTAGHVTVDDLNIHKAQSTQVAKTLAVLSQDNTIANRLTVADLVSFGRYPHSSGKLTDSDFIRIEDALTQVELTELRHRYIDQLSGGQRQRVFLGMVLAQDTPYILLDEPLNNLDIKHASALMRHLGALVGHKKKTIVVVLHDINFAAAHAGHIVAMRDGAIIKAGSPGDVLTSSVLSETFDTAVTVVPADRINSDQDKRHPVALYYS